VGLFFLTTGGGALSYSSSPVAAPLSSQQINPMKERASDTHASNNVSEYGLGTA